MIKPYDLGEILENTQKVKIDDLVRRAKSEFKLQFIKSSVEMNGVNISLTSSKTRFGGLRLWFLCPNCNKRRGVLYSKNNKVACSICLGLKYRRQRYKGMVELQTYPTP